MVTYAYRKDALIMITISSSYTPCFIMPEQYMNSFKDPLLPLPEVERGIQTIHNKISKSIESELCKQPLSHALQAGLDGLKVALEFAAIILTEGLLTSILGKTMTILSTINNLVYAITGYTIGEHIERLWPESKEAKWASVVIDTVFNFANPPEDYFEINQNKTINLSFNIEQPTLPTLLLDGEPEGRCQVSNIIDSLSSQQKTPALFDIKFNETYLINIWIKIINDELIINMIKNNQPRVINSSIFKSQYC